MLNFHRVATKNNLRVKSRCRFVSIFTPSEQKGIMSDTSWFESLFGLPEPTTRKEVQNMFVLSENDTVMTSKANGRQCKIGQFTTPTLQELRTQSTSALKLAADRTQCRSGDKALSKYVEFEHIVIGDCFAMHVEHPGAVFQVASQFNCLEFSSPRALPEDGVENYKYDSTQGHACALACAAGTVYRNYFVPCGEEEARQLGQSEDCQLNNLDVLEKVLKNKEHQFWYVQNGYTFCVDERNLMELAALIRDLSHVQRQKLLGKIKLGLQTGVGVDFTRRYTPVVDASASATTSTPTVTQVYCSAVSCAYSGHGVNRWEPLARLVLEAAYEGTLLVALQNHLRGSDASNESVAPGSVLRAAEATAVANVEEHDTVYLTFLGGGVFGNKMEWIASAIGRAMAHINFQCSECPSAVQKPLKVKICHYRSLNQAMIDQVDESYADWSDSLATLMFLQDDGVSAETAANSKNETKYHTTLF